MKVEKLKKGSLDFFKNKLEFDTICISDLKNFNISQTLDCGQCFRWKEFTVGDENFYIGVIKDKALKIYEKKGVFYFQFLTGFTEKDQDFILNYFDLNRDYGKIKEELLFNFKNDENLVNAVNYGYGIRILNQDFFETTISFIISARNSIPNIKKIIEYISKNFGTYICSYKFENGEVLDLYSFPNEEILKDVPIDEIRKSKAAFRSPYIVESSKYIYENKLNKEYFYNLRENVERKNIFVKRETLEYIKNKTVIKELLKLKGVGEKVADCINLFSLGDFYSFPVDTWIKKVMEKYYSDDIKKLYEKDNVSLKKLRELGVSKFKNYSGIAQQYLFYYEKEKI